MSFALHATGLIKRYGALVAVDGIDLAVRRGTCVGLLGPNGAGKTTTIEMLEGLKTPDGGTIRILDWTWAEHPHEIRERIGVQLQDTKLEDKLTVAEAVALCQCRGAGRRPDIGPYVASGTALMPRDRPNASGPP